MTPPDAAAPTGASITPRVRVIVVNHNGAHWLAHCLESLRVQTLADFEVVVIDNASSDGSQHLRVDDARFRFLPQALNLGFAAGNNLAARGASAPWLALLNPDAMARPDWLEQLLSEASAHPDCDIFGSTQLRATDPGILDGTGDNLALYGLTWRSGYGHPRPAVLPAGEVFGACGAALMIRRSVYEALGGFEERLFCYLEDVDLCFRARLQGSRVWQSDKAVVHHVGGASSVNASTFALYQGNRNLIWVYVRCMPLPWLWVSLPSCIGFMLLRVLVLPLSLMQRAALLRGIRDGLGARASLCVERRSIQASRTVSRFSVLNWLALNPLHAPRRHCVRATKAKCSPP
ncbi:MAG: glycosyltransferase family 2 protein [Panacagrimonas sp.]